MVDLEVAFPPGKKLFYIPSELIDESDLLCCEIITICGNPVFGAINDISNKSSADL